ncbi:MAG: hypothetical protein ACK4IX_00060 [Candidatus Sericytochromatia bacterium]
MYESKHHYKLSNTINLSNLKNKKKIVSLDTEWAKNWRAKEKFIPFCACLHTIYIDNVYDVIDLNNIEMVSELYFRSKHETTIEYLKTIDHIIGNHIDDTTLFVGHQLSSDLHSLQNLSDLSLDNVKNLIDIFKLRKDRAKFHELTTFDTRYDIKNRVIGNGNEKLRNVSIRYNVFAVQKELDKMSLTKMYNEYSLDNDDLKREKLTIMNWRHAFQTALITLIDIFSPIKLFSYDYNDSFLSTNESIFRMGYNSFEYLNSLEYKETCSLKEIQLYVSRCENK